MPKLEQTKKPKIMKIKKLLLSALFLCSSVFIVNAGPDGKTSSDDAGAYSTIDHGTPVGAADTRGDDSYGVDVYGLLFSIWAGF
jgi:hypothetical protein